MAGRIAVTGAHGFLGWHLRCHLKAMGHDDVVPIGRADFADDEVLGSALADADHVVHLAGMNRGDEDEIERANIDLADHLARILRDTGSEAQVVFANSVHRDRDTAYGRSKRRAAEILADWSERSGGRFCDLVIPNVFGEHGRPYYNSVVATFCHQLAEGEELTVHDDAGMELVHAQEVCAEIRSALEGGATGSRQLTGHEITVHGLVDRLRHFADEYEAHRVPDVRDPFDLKLFNTYRSFLFPRRYPVSLPVHSDERGSLVEAIKSENGGQTFVSDTRPGITRGNHFHLEKIERFLVLRGEAIIRLRRLFDDEVLEFKVGGSAPAYVDMPTLHTHNITNIGDDELVTLFWAHEIFDPDAPDTYREVV